MISRLIIGLFVALALPSAAARAQTNGALTESFSHDGVLTATLVAAPGKAHVGPFELEALTYNSDYAGPVLHIHPGDVMRIRLVNHLPSAFPEDLRAVRIDETRTVSFSQTKTIRAAEQKFFLNGKIFDADRTDLRVPLGNVEEWTIRNDSDDMHVFHIHQIGFQVLEVNGAPIPFNGYVDTVRIPQRGEVKLRLPFTDRLILGRFMFHCHVLKHEDGGMMANIEIYDPAPPALSARLNRLYMRVVWWWNGVPWALRGLPDV